MKTYSCPLPMGKENGSVYITGLIVVVIVTIIVISIMRSATLEERMASNSRNKQLALQAAEAVIRDAEASLFSNSPFSPFDYAGFDASCTNGLCAMPAAGTQRWQTINWSSTTNTRTFANAASKLKDSATHEMVNQPRYIVELIGLQGGAPPKVCPQVIFRITARGFSGGDSLFSGGAIVLVEDTYIHQPDRFADGSCGGI